MKQALLVVSSLGAGAVSCQLSTSASHSTLNDDGDGSTCALWCLSLVAQARWEGRCQRSMSFNTPALTSDRVTERFGGLCACRHVPRSLQQDGMLRSWRRQARPPCAAHSRCTVSGLGLEGRDVSACRQQWYQRQLHAQTLFPVDLLPLAQRLPSQRRLRPSLQTSGKETEWGSYPMESADAITDAFLSCCTSAVCDGEVLRSIFAQLSADQQCAVLSKGLSQETREQRFFLLNQCVKTALRNASFAPLHWIRVLSSVQGADGASPLPVSAIVESVLRHGIGVFACADDARTFVAKALLLMERQRTPFPVIVECLEACGLHYEACAYASSSSSFVLPFGLHSAKGPTTTEGVVSSGGERGAYGPLLYSMCALPRCPLKWFGEVGKEMPPVLRRYSVLVLLHAAVRRCGGVRGFEDDVWRQFTAELMSPLEAASALHFLLQEGSAFTAQLLLDYCHTAQQVLTLMRYTHGAQHAITFQALEKLLAVRTGERLITHLCLESRGRQQRTKAALVFDAQLGSCGATTRRAKVGSDQEGELAAETLSLTTLDCSHLHQYLNDAIPRSVLARGERSLSQMLAAIPSTAVEHVAGALPTMHSDALSWWVSLYLKGGNVDGALAVLRVIAARGCLPHMAVLVELLECTQDDTESFVRSVTLIQQNFAKVADTVLRAFVERTATLMTRAPAAPTSATTQAVHTLKSLAVMGLPQLSTRCLNGLATQGAPDTIHAMVALAQELCNLTNGKATEAASLDIAAIRGLAVAGRQLRYRVRLSVVALAGDKGEFISWWGTASRPLHSLTSFAYASQDLSLWPWVRAEALAASASLSPRDLHKAARVVALGSRDAKTAVDFWTRVKERVKDIDDVKEARATAKRASQSSEAITALCVYAVCAAEGQGHLAAHLLRSLSSPSRANSHTAPPSRSSVSTLHRVALHQQRPKFKRDQHRTEKGVHLSRDALLASRVKRRWTGQRRIAKQSAADSLWRHLPPSLKRLLCVAGPKVVAAVSHHLNALDTAEEGDQNKQ